MADRAGREDLARLGHAAEHLVLESVEPFAIGARSCPDRGAVLVRELHVLARLIIGRDMRVIDCAAAAIGPVERDALAARRVVGGQIVDDPAGGGAEQELRALPGQHVGEQRAVEILARQAQAVRALFPHQLAQKRVGLAILRVGQRARLAEPADRGLVLQLVEIAAGIGEHRGERAALPGERDGFGEFLVRARIGCAGEAAEAVGSDQIDRIAGGEADCASQPVTAIERRCGPAQDFDRFDQADIGVAATARFLRAEGEALRRADAVDLDQHAIAADPADHEILVPRAAQRAQRRPEARRCTAHRDTRFVTDQILDVGHHVIGDVFGVDHGDGGGHIFDSERRAGCGDDDLFALPSCLRGLFTAGGSVLRVNRAGQGRCAQQKRDTESVVPHDDPFVAIDSR